MIPAFIQEKSAKAVLVVFILTLIIVTFLLFIPSMSGALVFSKGNFAYIESLGMIFIYQLLMLTATYFIFLYFFNRKTLKGNKTPNIKIAFIEKVFLLGMVGASILLLCFVVTMSWIRYDVKNHCREAVLTYGGDCLSAQLQLLDDPRNSYRARNSAIWVLGQLADKRSLPTLKKYYTGKIPLYESLGKTISQYELQKAIRWCSEGNVTKWMYKGL